MVPHEPSAAIEPASRPDASESSERSEASAPRSSRLAISRGRLLAILAVVVPAVASLLAPVLTEDIAYHLRVGQLMLASGSLVQSDPFTFTVAGEPWLNQQWAASAAFAMVYDATGWTGLLLLRAVLIGAAFGLVYLACRGQHTSQTVSALVTMAAFVVALTNLALRSQLFGVLCFAAVLAVLSWRHRRPLVLWLVPLLMVVWANTHGSFFVAWAALGLALLEDVVARRRTALLTGVVLALSVVATLLNPWGVGMWSYVVELTRNPLIATLVSEWQAATLRTPTGIFFYVSLALVLALLLVRGRAISWLQVLWLAGLALVSLLATRNVIWWAIGAAPVVAVLLAGLELRGRRVGDPAWDAPRGVGYAAIVGLVLVLALAALPVWRGGDALHGPEGLVQHAPRGLTEAIAAEAEEGDRLFTDQQWASWFELAVPGVPVMVDTRIELFARDIWSDYLAVVEARADWAEILDRWQVDLVAIEATNAPLRPFLDADPGWQLHYEDEDGVLFARRSGG